MKVGDLIKFGYVYPGYRLNGEIAVYLGENVVHRQDGIVVVNHKCYANGVGTVILDKALLKHIRVYDEGR
tara:strand:+ start:137 stop:346 length:210 start_codon:yes stop_codon:yes gene_type:complete